MKNHKTAQVTSYEKYLRQGNLGPKTDDDQGIAEKELTHRQENEGHATTEHQLDKEKEWVNVPRSEKDAQTIEKILNEAEGKYFIHRSDSTWLSVPPMSAYVEDLRQKRLAEDWKPSKEDNWTTTKPNQNGFLPSWPKTAPQHDKFSLNNDPDRFKGIKNMVDGKADNKIMPLVGNITTAQVDNVVKSIKTGESIDYDSAIVAILKSAEEEKRELTDVEKKAVVDLKVARTQKFIKC